MSNTLYNCNGQSEVISGNIFIRKVKLSKIGDQVGGHAHNFDHTTIFLRGSVQCNTILPECGCKHEYIFHAGDHFLIDAKTIHTLIALEDNTEFWCVFSHRDTDGVVIDRFKGNLSAFQ